VGDKRLGTGPGEGSERTRTCERAAAVANDRTAGHDQHSLALLRSPLGATRRAGDARVDAMLALQRAAGNRVAQRVLARDLAIAPTAPNAPLVNLSALDLRSALGMNRVLFTDAAELQVIRDVLGLSQDPAVVDDDLARAIAAYQASYGLTVDGKLGSVTSGRLAAELTAESNALLQAPTGGRLRRTARRLHLRSMVTRTRGTYVHQGFVGPDETPDGCVTVRANDTAGGTNDNISLEYTGEDSNGVHWLQFVTDEVFGTPPGGAQTFATGTVGTTNGTMTWTTPGAQSWVVDSIPSSPAASPSPFYDVSGGFNTSAANRSRVMIDEPGGASALGTAQGFAAAGPGQGSPTVTFRASFSSYLVKSNHPRYRVDWSASTGFTIAAATPTGPIQYRNGWAGPVTRLRPEHRTALLAKYAGNPIN
jgi:hypothetical protein